MTLHYVNPDIVQHMLDDGDEIALIDVREPAEFSQGHLWLANNLPASTIALSIQRFVPRRTTRIIIVDNCEGAAHEAVSALQPLGYDQLYILEYGIEAWVDAGYNIIKGDYVIAHSLGYFLHSQYQLETVTPLELKTRKQRGEEFLIIDTRAESDYQDVTIDESINIPAAEVIHRLPKLVSNDETTVVIHCAGITRAALGVLAALNSGVPNPILSLVDGTRGWAMLGEQLVHGKKSITSSEHGHKGCGDKSLSSKAATKLAHEYNLEYQSYKDIEPWKCNNPHRTCYLIDVRSSDEYIDEHYPQTLSIPGGELAGMTIDHLATRNARLCLFADPDCARAELTASWMLQQGWSDIVIINDWRSAPKLESGEEKSSWPIKQQDQKNMKTDQSNQTENLQWHQQCIDLRHSIYQQFQLDKPIKFRTPTTPTN